MSSPPEYRDAQAAPRPADAARAAPPSGRTRIRRIPENARYETATVHAIIDAALVCHVAFADAAGVHCIPTACWRQGNGLHIHGSNGSRLIRALQSGAAAAVTITLVDGLVLARSAFNHSMNYRSVVAYGVFSTMPDAAKPALLAAFLEHLVPGRQGQVRAGDGNELAATTVLRLDLAEAAAKVRTGPPQDDAADLGWPVWAGVLPLQLVPGPAQVDASCALPAPENIRAWTQRRFDAG